MRVAGSSRSAPGPFSAKIKDVTFMRRIALSGLLLLSGCTGFGHFISDTHSINGSPNAPKGDSLSMQRATGKPGVAPVIAPESGQVWPTAIPTMPSLAQIQQQMNLSGNGVPQLGPVPSGPGQIPSLSTLPGLKGTAPATQTPATQAPVALPSLPSLPNNPGETFTPPPALTMPKIGSVVQTPQGPATITGGTANYQTLGPIGGQTGGILIPNGNGTSTLVMPNGTISTLTTPK
ncbi:hypothetical protein AcidC75_25630 [Acidisoma sp. C75]